MRSLLLAVALVGLSTPAFAEDTFESMASSAIRIKRVDDMVWALTAKCDAGTDTQQRQCRRIRDARAAELRNSVMLVDGDRGAFNVGPWSAAKKSVSMTVSACIRCSGIDVEGKSWFVAGTREANQPPRFSSGRQVGAQLAETSRTFSDDASAKKYASSIATAKVQFLVRVPQAPVWSDSNRQGIAFEVLAYRVYSPCDGSVVVSRPKAGPGEIDTRACAGIPPAGVEVAELTPAMIKASIQPTLDAAKTDCYARYGAKGTGKLKLQIGPDGVITGASVEGELANSDTAKCISAAMKHAVLPRSKKPKTQCAVPLSLP